MREAASALDHYNAIVQRQGSKVDLDIFMEQCTDVATYAHKEWRRSYDHNLSTQIHLLSAEPVVFRHSCSNTFEPFMPWVCPHGHLLCSFPYVPLELH